MNLQEKGERTNEPCIHQLVKFVYSAQCLYYEACVSVIAKKRVKLLRGFFPAKSGIKHARFLAFTYSLLISSEHTDMSNQRRSEPEANRMRNTCDNMQPAHASVSQRGQASLDRSKLEKEKLFTPERNEQYKITSRIIHCPHGDDPSCPCVKGTKYEDM